MVGEGTSGVALPSSRLYKFNPRSPNLFCLFEGLSENEGQSPCFKFNKQNTTLSDSLRCEPNCELSISIRAEHSDEPYAPQRPR